MYVDPMTIYREYAQNAADAVDEGRAFKLLMGLPSAKDRTESLRREYRAFGAGEGRGDRYGVFPQAARRRDFSKLNYAASSATAMTAC